MRKTRYYWLVLLSLSLVLTGCMREEVDQDALTTIITLTAEARQTQGLPDTSGETDATPSPQSTEEPLLQPTDMPSPELGAPARLSQIAGAAVLNQAGEPVGQAADLILDLQSRRVVYLVLTTGSLLGIGEEAVLMPWDALMVRIDQDQQNLVFTSAVAQELIAQAPQVGEISEIDFSDAEWDASHRQYWEGVLTEQRQTATPEVEDEPAARSWLGEQLLNLPVFSAGGEEIGRVEEVLFDLEEGEVQYLVVSAGGVLGIGEKWIPTPVSVLEIDPNGEQFTLLADRQHLIDAPNYDLAQLPDSSDPDWDAGILEYWQEIR
jgi:sporulation protein YlmC with PRC-barrel domain